MEKIKAVWIFEAEEGVEQSTQRMGDCPAGEWGIVAYEQRRFTCDFIP